jgi:hypothetical protein
MAYGVNSPFGLRPYGHQISGVCDIKVNSNYTISANSSSLNKGDPVMYVPQATQYNIVANGYQGKQPEIMLYNPAVTLQAGGTATTVIPTNGIAGQPIVGVFQGCEYYAQNGDYVVQEYWQSGTVTKGPVIASIIDDPYVIYDIQLGTYTGATFGTLSRFMLLPCLQIQDASWPDTGGANTNPVTAASCVIGSNLTLMTGSNVASVVGAGNSASMADITLNGIDMNYQDNPLIANQGLVNGNPWGISTFYACPSLAVTSANPSLTNGGNEYGRTTALGGDLRVLGFTPDPRNVPGAYGQPGLNVTGNYFNTPFLNVLVTINKHANKQGNSGVTIA